MEFPQSRQMSWRTVYYATWASIGVLILVGVALWGIGRLAGAIAPFGIAFLFVFLMQGAVARLVQRGVGRSAAVAACFAVGFLVVSLALVFIVPVVTRQLVSFARDIHQYRAQVQSVIDQVLASRLFGDLSDMTVPDMLKDAAETLSLAGADLFVDAGNLVARGIVSTGTGLATIVFDLFLGTVIAYWTLRDLPKIRAELRVLAGDKYEDDLENLLSTVGRVVGGYLRGQTVASLVTGLLAGIGLAIIGVPYALVLGLITFVLNYVPYVGPIISAGLAGLMGLFIGWPQALVAIGIVIAAQQVTDLFITPRVMSDQVDLHPTLVIFSLLVGGVLLGFWGMILAIPVAATTKGLFVYYWEARTDRSLASEDGALFRAAPQSDGDDDLDGGVTPQERAIEVPNDDEGAGT
ncbi:MAG: AI-2E family transporter [Coriobacteriia bacterium]|nr:AI-2E family transporter [Coriobacteriia bacterium]